MWENLVPSSITQEQEVNEFYQSLNRRFVDAEKPQPGPSSEHEPQRKKRRIEGSGSAEGITEPGPSRYKRKYVPGPQPDPEYEPPCKRLRIGSLESEEGNSESQLPGEIDDKPETHLSGATTSNQEKQRR